MTTRDKFAAVVESMLLNEVELDEYCRKKGIYPEQIKSWREACEQANDWDKAQNKKLKKQQQEDRQRFKSLERERKMTEQYPPQEFEDEINLADLFLIVWKHKMMIFAVTLLLTIAAAGTSFIMPKVYKVVTILKPGRNIKGQLVDNPLAIRENILGGTYDQLIAEKLSLSLDKIPKMDVSIPKKTDLVIISIESSKPQQAVLILQTLLTNITEKSSIQLQIERNLINNKIKTAVSKESLFCERIQMLKSQIQQMKLKITELENLRKTTLSNSRDNSVAILLYLNDIRNQQVFLNKLQEKLFDLQGQKTAANLEISTLRLKLADINETIINKEPSIPGKPVKPKKALMVALGFMLGLMGGIMLAFFKEKKL